MSKAVLPGRAREFRRKRPPNGRWRRSTPVPAYLDLWPSTLYITSTCCRPALTDIRRGFEFPRTSSPLAGSSFKRGLGARGLFGFLKP
jgi:hypothetical protein